MKILSLDRSRYTKDTSIGELFLPDKTKFCYSLEDSCRAYGVKVKGFTAIPATTSTFYKIDVTFSQRFQKELPIIYTDIENGRYILRNGIEFEGIRFHAGTTVSHTDGCIISAYNYDGVDKVWDSAADDLTKLIKEYLKSDTVGIKIRNLKNAI